MRRQAPVVVFVVWLSALVAATMIGCSSSGNSDGGSSGGMTGNGGSNSGGGMMGNGGSNSGGGMMGNGGSNSGGGMMGNGGSSANSSSSVGERIYLTGVGADGQDISRTAPAVSRGSLMMGGGGCASCHGANGRGATIKMMTGTAIKAPDITYDALVQEGFTDTAIGRAIRDGLDESGKPLEEAMPRWQISDADVGATIVYLKELGAP